MLPENTGIMKSTSTVILLLGKLLIKILMNKSFITSKVKLH